MNPGTQQAPFDFRSFFREKSVLSGIIILNVAIWTLIQVLKVILFLYNKETSGAELHRIIDLLAVPAYLPNLAHQPWSLLTYMVLHENIWHILFNMLWLYWFGKIFIQYLTQRQLMWVYILGGMSGALVYILAANLFPVFNASLPDSFALGASASVMAIVTAIAFYVPNYTLYLLLLGRVRIVYLAVALFIFDFFMIPTGNAGGHLAHIGGMLFGYLWVKWLMPAWRGRFRMPRIRLDFLRKKTKGGGPGSFSGRPVSDDEYNARRADNQRRIDEILDKISRGGYESLTKEEKEFLFQSSRKN